MPLKSRSAFGFQRHFRKQSATDFVYFITFCYLILFGILNSLYVETAPYQKAAQFNAYNVNNAVVNPVVCSFPISSQYHKTPRSICYLLLIVTVLIRNQKWLAAGAAASVLTYSGVAAIHLLVLFATNNRLHLQQAKTRCESIPTPGSNTRFAACAGISDPDVSIIVRIVTTVMLGALPMVAWSTTFRKSASKAILMFWLLLLAVGHTFYPLTSTNPNFHFQICPKDYVEPLPKKNFQAPVFDDTWSESFHSLVSASQQASPPFENDSVPACLYSCFATTAYVGRNDQEIVVYAAKKPNPFIKSVSKQRLAVIIFWWAYAFLALLTFLTTEKQRRLPKWVFKRVCSVEYHQKPWMSIWKRSRTNENATNMVSRDQGSGKDTMMAKSLAVDKAPSMRHFQVTILRLVQFVTQISSVAAFVGVFLYNEITENALHQRFLEQEQFAAVGQWSCVAVVLLVLFAAVVGRIWATDEEIQSTEKDDESRDVEWMGMEEWDWRVGYAS
ncbi:hypothetical protein G7Y79_00034g069730 [Physcia stellaris]|nr:hypothetical protein G7Y79_00034g069730 [Physcia stellaris]